MPDATWRGPLVRLFSRLTPRGAAPHTPQQVGYGTAADGEDYWLVRNSW